MTEDYPSWMRGHDEELRQAERRVAEELLARQRAAEEEAREREAREAPLRAAAAEADRLADVMIRDTYDRVLRASLVPGAKLRVEFSWNSEITAIGFGKAWVIAEPSFYRSGSGENEEHIQLPGLWLDREGNLRTARIQRMVCHRNKRPEQPSIQIDEAYPRVTWFRDRPSIPADPNGWILLGPGPFAPWSTGAFPCITPQEQQHCAECKPGTPLVPVQPREVTDDPHSAHLGRILVQFMRRRNLLANS